MCRCANSGLCEYLSLTYLYHKLHHMGSSVFNKGATTIHIYGINGVEFLVIVACIVRGIKLYS